MERGRWQTNGRKSNSPQPRPRPWGHRSLLGISHLPFIINSQSKTISFTCTMTTNDTLTCGDSCLPSTSDVSNTPKFYLHLWWQAVLDPHNALLPIYGTCCPDTFFVKVSVLFLHADHLHLCHASDNVAEGSCTLRRHTCQSGSPASANLCKPSSAQLLNGSNTLYHQYFFVTIKASAY